MAAIETYKRGYHSTGRGHQSTVTCGFCGKKVPRYKCCIIFRGFSMEAAIVKEIGSKNIISTRTKVYVCPACARSRGIVQKKNEEGLKVSKRRNRR